MISNRIQITDALIILKTKTRFFLSLLPNMINDEVLGIKSVNQNVVNYVLTCSKN